MAAVPCSHWPPWSRRSGRPSRNFRPRSSTRSALRFGCCSPRTFSWPDGRVQIDRMPLALRPRGPWEGADLGVVMLRAWARPVYAAMIATVIPVALAAHLLIGNLFLALLLVWWLKPLYDRVV